MKAESEVLDERVQVDWSQRCTVHCTVEAEVRFISCVMYTIVCAVFRKIFWIEISLSRDADGSCTTECVSGDCPVEVKQEDCTVVKEEPDDVCCVISLLLQDKIL